MPPGTHEGHSVSITSEVKALVLFFLGGLRRPAARRAVHHPLQLRYARQSHLAKGLPVVPDARGFGLYQEPQENKSDEDVVESQERHNRAEAPGRVGPSLPKPPARRDGTDEIDGRDVV